MKKTELLEEKVAAAELSRAADRLDGLVAEVFEDGLYDLLDEQEQREGRPLARVAYEEKSRYCNGGEAYVIYLDTARSGDWGMSCACPVKNDMVSYQLVTQIRELMRLGYEIRWS